MKDDYDEVAIKEDGYTVEFSNRGSIPKENPTPVNYNKEKIKCMHEGCQETTKSMFGFCTKHSKESVLHERDWIGRIIPPGKDREACITWAPTHSLITEMLIKWMKEDESKRCKIMDDFMNDILDSIVAKIPDATTLQSNINGVMKGTMSPKEMLTLGERLVDKHFPKEKYGDKKISGRYKPKGEDAVNFVDIPLRVVAMLLFIAFACEESNRGDMWFLKSHGLNEDSSKRASAFMSSVYYLIRRHTKASEKQAKISTRW
jgi:hypothetical protein